MKVFYCIVLIKSKFLYKLLTPYLDAPKLGSLCTVYVMHVNFNMGIGVWVGFFESVKQVKISYIVIEFQN